MFKNAAYVSLSMAGLGIFVTHAPAEPTTRTGIQKTLKVAGGTIVEYHFNKKYGAPSSCMVDEKQHGGNMEICPIDLPANVPGGIVQVNFSCSPVAAPCDHTVECPSGGICGPHLYSTEPHNLPADKPRSLKWYGWTDDGNDSVITLRVFVQ